MNDVLVPAPAAVLDLPFSFEPSDDRSLTVSFHHAGFTMQPPSRSTRPAISPASCHQIGHLSAPEAPPTVDADLRLHRTERHPGRHTR